MHQVKNKLVLFMPSMEGGGVEKNLIIIANHLIKNINYIYLITFDKKFIKKFDNKIKIIIPKIKTNQKYSKYQKYFFCILCLIKIIIKEKKISIFSFQANIYCIIIAKIFNKKIVIRSNSSPSGWTKNIIKNSIFKFFFKRADQIIVNSKYFKKQIDKMFNINSTMIYNPLNKKEILTKSKIKLNTNPFGNAKCLKIINIARFTDQKNHTLLLNSLKALENTIKYKLIIMGYGSNLILIKNLINKYKMKDNVTILNFKSNPYQYINCSDLFILTSNYEGLPNVLLEAMTLKKLIISTDCPTGPKEILQNNKLGILSKLNDEKDLSNKIYLVNKNLNSYKKLTLKAYKSLDRFDYTENLSKYLKTINKII